MQSGPKRCLDELGMTLQGMSQAVIEIMSRNQHIKTVNMKYSIPGHSGVQEVDSMHSQIEHAMHFAEFYSPIPFIHILLKAHRQKPCKVIQMKATDFKEHMNCAKLIPFKKVVELEFSSNDLYDIKYKTSFKQQEHQSVCISSSHSSRNSYSLKSIIITPRVQKGKKELDKAKKEDLKSMLRFMPILDQEYYRTLGI